MVYTQAQLIALINEYITTNGENEITGAQLNEVLQAMATLNINVYLFAYDVTYTSGVIISYANQLWLTIATIEPGQTPETNPASYVLLTNSGTPTLAEVLEAGAEASGAINMDNNAINNLPAPVDSGDATNKAYVDGTFPLVTLSALRAMIIASTLVYPRQYIITNAAGGGKAIKVYSSSSNTLYLYAENLTDGLPGQYNISTDTFTQY